MEEEHPEIRGKRRCIPLPPASVAGFGMVFAWMTLCLTLFEIWEPGGHDPFAVALHSVVAEASTEAVASSALPISGETEKNVEDLLAGGLSHPLVSVMRIPETPPLCGIGPEIPAGDGIGAVKRGVPSPETVGHPEGKFNGMILKAANRHQLDPALIKAVIKAESGYNTRAVSKRGAMGLMQLMPSTARALGVVDLLDPEHNINGGAKYLRQLMDRFDGDVRLVLAAYNAGSKRVRQYRGVPPFKATRYYIKKVLGYYQIYKKQMDKPRGSA